jgi:hypothetical protein
MSYVLLRYGHSRPAPWLGILSLLVMACRHDVTQGGNGPSALLQPHTSVDLLDDTFMLELERLPAHQPAVVEFYASWLVLPHRYSTCERCSVGCDGH